METQGKYLEFDYLATRMRDFLEIRKGNVRFEIVRSSREHSKSLYVRFMTYSKGVWHKNHVLRVSDHIVHNEEQTQFIVDPNMPLTKKFKLKFIRTVENSIKRAQKRDFGITLKSIGRK